MSASTLGRGFRLSAALGLFALAAVVGTSSADVPTVKPDVTTVKINDLYHFSGTIDPIACLGPDAGTISGQGTAVGGATFSNGPQPAPFFNVHLTFTEDGRIDFPNGTYVLDHWVQHFTYTSGAGYRPYDSRTAPVQEQGTVYGPDGQPTGETVLVHEVAHATYYDANHNDEIDPGEYTVNVDRFRVTCR
jgi:hypothetical protein